GQDLKARVVLRQVQTVDGVDGDEEAEVERGLLLQQLHHRTQAVTMEDPPGGAGPIGVALGDTFRELRAHDVQGRRAQGLSRVGAFGGRGLIGSRSEPSQRKPPCTKGAWGLRATSGSRPVRALWWRLRSAAASEEATHAA